MIKCNLAVLLVERNLKMADVVRDTGIAKTTIRALYYNTSKGVQFDTLNTLCTYLNVTPGELMLYHPSEYQLIDVDMANIEDTFEAEFLWISKGKRTIYNVKAEVNVNGRDEEDEITDLRIEIIYPRNLYDELFDLPHIFSNDIDNEIVNSVLEYYVLADNPSISIYIDKYE
ncbi:helix-turn-helix domain-containing protein [Aneurinibacillus migulanus]|uniref:Cro/C1-type HTH DNA-binding domain-containing protein n=1 Tax=Aneurinibacillus migulanus TaxID=47500 RepID=A0A1G8WFM5_ANEMI|nr:helix-turn-helix transcriptional regulator [Aneurinibacillus migulanus]MED0894891.1 helix-turn-helix transcriptional regulator [Aneurinibacillus migulanus]MED1614465.1 helix-turn-helix transcriptional regulator [Aneurinibacillus migulanus]GED14879.1 hypothetical protein AMI01nite_28700 [Aneurinibacillus migulanus]SDJ76976.1 Cro/C1-type HTH DNA-binding domain-containing protein [Aneurinibacillus migulanus]